jgi:hypothetical protein
MIPSGPRMKASRQPGLRVSGPIAIPAPLARNSSTAGVHIIDGQTDMLQAVIRKGRRRRSGFVWVRRGDQYGLTTQPHRDALLARIERAGRIDPSSDLGAEHGLEEPCCRVRVGAGQMDVIVSIFAHPRSASRR